MNPLGYLALAIVSEIIATTFLKLSEGFTKLVPSIVVVIGYGTAFYMLSQALRQNMPIGIAYAIWSGVGTVAIAGIGLLIFGESLNPAKVIGIALVVVGVVILNLAGGTH